MTAPFLTMWVIYYGAGNHPPGKWVVRAQDVEFAGCQLLISAHARGEPGTRPHEIFHECDTLEEARAKVPPGLQCFVRGPSDDPVIVECWL